MKNVFSFHIIYTRAFSILNLVFNRGGCRFTNLKITRSLSVASYVQIGYKTRSWNVNSRGIQIGIKFRSWNVASCVQIGNKLGHGMSLPASNLGLNPGPGMSPPASKLGLKPGPGMSTPASSKLGIKASLGMLLRCVV